jgi:hypothetical protein
MVIGLCGAVNTAGYNYNVASLRTDQKLGKEDAAQKLPLMGQIAGLSSLTRAVFLPRLCPNENICLAPEERLCYFCFLIDPFRKGIFFVGNHSKYNIQFAKLLL